ncbi:PTS mannitol transporter subunit IICBA [Butyricicoccus porcorum]|uniref:PTS mannitol transporter subunit IICBA n=1 Tax=Butyricicoccus porcorum TaxID=1945634 RepID=UPI0023578B98|nr:PTS mannitol transporter subunit IICBA [Butyricicoccus porcorum]MDD6987270.1 PTS mannitol transporter subunit IICBA [Butyricicoccus porcorum]MDY4483937.1 PTS mannitol transporter subunit IICBA [Butyricicoccus porcorum]
MKQAVQRFGKFLSGMVMPNIGAFIAWGFITALFIEAGWIPNEKLAQFVTPMLNYLLPVLIAYTGGKMVGGDRGGVMGGIAVIGVIVGAPDYPMLMGAMVMGPFAGWVIKKFDQAMDGHMPAGFEMLINNFSIGILGMLLAILGYYAIGPFMSIILVILSKGVEILVNHGLLPLVAIFIEPAKVLFLNNAINHGIFTPIGLEQAATAGKSIMYMLETNPGPGLGVLLAYWMFSKDKATKDSAPGAIIIHLFGGIHEIYFPYILMNPFVIVAPILGNVCAILFFSITGAGLVGPPAPGSIISFLAMTPKGGMIISIIGVCIAAVVSFLVASPIVKMAGAKNLEESQNQMASMKAEAKGTAAPASISTGAVKKIVFACDAGMGSSAMGATKFRNRIKPLNTGITVTNTSVDNVPADCDIVVCQVTLQERAKKSAPQAQLVTIGNFLADPNLDSLYNSIANMGSGGTATAVAEPEQKEESSGNKTVMLREGVKLGLKSVSKEEAIRAAGELLKEIGCVGDAYVDAMLEREKLVTTYMGLGVAIPHGTTQAKGEVKKSGIVMLQYPEGVPFGDEKAQLVFGIAGVGDEHLDLLANISNALEDEDLLEKLKTTNDVDLILKTFS